ncbi:type VI secretion system Vgr family protein [Leisingera aquaemixtae]|uniref:Type VI secretion system Vgr family protein n=1 Tax=Leisingera aquaemixtae TaxID=1396826 RepID=A0A0P1H5Z7_9RHOB|nr:type VI secretion system tip protein TssI/VgrG [Leisingera aquaemixtae]CUH98432.1 type VI secretion system Vgr family protein [Leisingera aquaemixtae]
MVVSKGHENDLVWMSGTYATDGLMMSRAIVREGLSKLTETTIEFAATKAQPKLEDLVGKQMNVHVMRQQTEHQFNGICVSVEHLGFRNGYEMFVAEVRPWFWMLTRTCDLRVYQDKTTVEIIKQLFSEYGFSDFTDKLSDSYTTREYCLQYRESDFNFLCRLMEEEGIYYYFESPVGETTREKLILCDGVSGHSPINGGATVEFHARDDSDRRREEHISEWTKDERVTRGKVTLNDFDFLTPSADLKATSAIAKGKHSYKDYEVYDYQGHYRKDSTLGTKLARVRMEAEAIRHIRWRGASSVPTLVTGCTFTMKEHPVSENNKEYLVIDAEHHIKVAWDYGERESQKRKEVATKGAMRRDLKAKNMDVPAEMEHDVYASTFGAILKSEQFRAPLVTPWPEVQGLQTATVVGQSGEEIWTDEHGRIKIQFHWDREGKKNETSSCFVRVMTPWSGKNWGMVAIPRMGQEVVIQFEDGNPDRPICTGMLYNAETMPPYTYPDDQTQLGIKTNSSKGGGGYNELMFDDKKDSELMRVQAQKDHQMLVKDRSTVTVGLDAPDPEVTSADEKSYVFTVQQHMTETVHQGDRTEVVETGDKSETIQTGNMTLDIDTGNLTETIAQGNHTETVSLGNLTVDVTAGKIAMSAGQEIKLTVGASEVKIDNSGVTIKGPMIKIEGTGMVEAKAPMTTVKGEAMLTLKGGLTMIN